MDDAAFYFSHCRAFSRQNNCKKNARKGGQRGPCCSASEHFDSNLKLTRENSNWIYYQKITRKSSKKKDFCYRLFIYTETIIQKITKNQTLEKDTKNPKKNIKKFKDWFSPSLKINRRKQSNPKKMMNTKSSKIVLPKKATISKKNLKMLDNFSPLVDNQKNVKKNY